MSAHGNGDGGRGWDIPRVQELVRLALGRIEESRKQKNETTLVSTWNVHAEPDGLVLVTLTMADGSTEQVRAQTPAITWQ